MRLASFLREQGKARSLQAEVDIGLIERRGEIAVFECALDAAAGGHGGILVVEGPAGIGKTSLVRAGMSLAGDRDFVVLRARGGEMERAFPFGIARQLLERPVATAPPEARHALLSGAAGLAAPALGLASAEGGTRAPVDPSFGPIHGLYWLVATMAERQPVLLAVDDVQWADQESLRFLLYLGRRVAELPVVIVVATRFGEPAVDGQTLDALSLHGDAQVLRPQPLTKRATERLVADRLGPDADKELATVCYEETKGNPFLLTELLAQLRADGISSGVGMRVGNFTPRAVARSILLRVGRLPMPAGELAQAIAILGDGAWLRDAVRLAGLDEAPGVQAAAALARTEFIDDGDPISFVHPLVRSAVYGDIPRSVRASRHADAARLLASNGEAPIRIAPHLLLAAPAADPWAVATLRNAAAGALANGASATAACFLRRALAEPPAADERGELLAETGVAELIADELREAVRHLRDSYECAESGPVRGTRALMLAPAVAATTGIEAAASLLTEAVEALADDHRELALQLEARLATIGTMSPELAPRTWSRLERFSDVEGETPGERLVLAALAMRSWYTGSRPATEVADICRRAIADGAIIRDADLRDLTWTAAVSGLIFTDRLDAARATLTAGLDLANRSGWADGIMAVMILTSQISLRCGDLAAADDQASAGIAFLDHISSSPFRNAARANMVLYRVEIAVDQGRLDEADALLHSYGLADDIPADLHTGITLHRRALLRLAQGRDAASLADVAAHADIERRAGIDNPTLAWRCVAARVHARMGDQLRARALAEEQLRLARSWALPRDVGIALITRAVVDQGAMNLDLLSEAVSVLETSPARLEYGRALVELGAALRRAGKRGDAKEVLMRGADVARTCGATVLAARAVAELKVLGARPRRRAFSGVESLTASERRVAELAIAGDGMTNREIAQALFVTQKTVEHHLANVFRKVDIQRRDQLVAVLTRDPATSECSTIGRDATVSRAS